NLIGFSPGGGQLAAYGLWDTCVWDLGRIGQRLREIGLDWDLPPHPPAPDPEAAPSVPVDVDYGPYPLGLRPDRYLQPAGPSARRGRWADAAADYATALELDPKNHLTWHDAAPLLLEVGDIDGYRRVCREMLARFGRPTDPYVADRTAKTC